MCALLPITLGTRNPRSTCDAAMREASGLKRDFKNIIEFLLQTAVRMGSIRQISRDEARRFIFKTMEECDERRCDPSSPVPTAGSACTC